jgi:hypothetical protein
VEIKITLDVTPGTAKRLAYVGLTLVALGATAGAYAALPVKFQSQQKLTAAQLNQNFDDLDGRVNATGDALAAKADKQQVPIITDWQSYVPTLTTQKGVDVSNQTSTAFYRRVGDTLEVRFFTVFSAKPTSGALWWQWGLPGNLLIDLTKNGEIGLAAVGSGTAQQGEAQIVSLSAYVRSNKGVSATGAGSGSYYINDTVPVALDAGGQVTLDFRVPIVGWSATQ